MDEFAHEWVPENVAATAFFKCTRWLVEETGDTSGCAYHYFCDTAYAGNYAPVVDSLVLVFAAALYLSATVFTLLRLVKSEANVGNSKRRYLLPSGPVAVPAILLVLANGSRINTLFPLSVAGPAIVHLLHVSALSFEYRSSVDRGLKYAVLEASTVSGILHASLYLDSIVVPYYTGLGALRRSSLSGECATCVCRSEPLAIGGGLVSYRGWSRTVAAVVGTLCLRMLSRALGEGRSSPVIKLGMAMESLSWVLVASDVVYLMTAVPHPRGSCDVLNAAAYGGLLLLIFLNVLRKGWGFLVRLAAGHQKYHQNRVYLCKNSVEYP